MAGSLTILHQGRGRWVQRQPLWIVAFYDDVQNIEKVTPPNHIRFFHARINLRSRMFTSPCRCLSTHMLRNPSSRLEHTIFDLLRSRDVILPCQERTLDVPSAETGGMTTSVHLCCLLVRSAPMVDSGAQSVKIAVGVSRLFDAMSGTKGAFGTSRCCRRQMSTDGKSIPRLCAVRHSVLTVYSAAYTGPRLIPKTLVV
ncbi:hypothetical protein CC86DRAFT_194741 [Ophiobolus disseminans]|uniref:Uncharacterized protein n=1 Tax=Ophiobolus disseminans TaxID=1469910 RepID=A0A6A7A733_9PLEO|nr:hypothetical protein CC86DRAFT_194741 [Ophiobolus disseminans]